MIRTLTGSEQDERTKKSLTNVYKIFSGYTHAGYAHIMQMYGGSRLSLSFNIAGIPSQAQKDMHMQLVIEAYKSTLNATAYDARTFSKTELYRDVMQYRQSMETKGVSIPWHYLKPICLDLRIAARATHLGTVSNG
jgi:hypothetical protein